MATVGKIPKFGFGAGAKKYVVLDGFSTHPTTVGQPRIPTLGFGSSAGARLTLLGFVANPVGGGGGGVAGGWIFGDAVVS